MPARTPVRPNIFSRGSRSISDFGNGVRSRVARITSKSASAAAASSSDANGSVKNRTSARRSSGDQSAEARATRCQSSRTATRVFPGSDMALLEVVEVGTARTYANSLFFATSSRIRFTSTFNPGPNSRIW